MLKSASLYVVLIFVERLRTILSRGLQKIPQAPKHSLISPASKQAPNTNSSEYQQKHPFLQANRSLQAG